jgi:uncharacterized membrane protein YeaQ/YmgE (transglycosylase-associated protein family)
MARKGVDPAQQRLVKTIMAGLVGALFGALLLYTLAGYVDLYRVALIVFVATALSTIFALRRRGGLATSTQPQHQPVPPSPVPSPPRLEKQSPGSQPYGQPPQPATGSYSGHSNRSQPHSSPTNSSQPEPSRPKPNQQSSSGAAPFQPPPLPPAEPAHAVIAISPQGAAPAGGPPSGWWNQTGRRPISASTEAPPGETPDISSYVGSGQIVQCPNCAAFTVDYERVEAGFNFRCQACGYEFRWQRGEEWPAWKISPRSRSNP